MLKNKNNPQENNILQITCPAVAHPLAVVPASSSGTCLPSAAVIHHTGWARGHGLIWWGRGQGQINNIMRGKIIQPILNCAYNCWWVSLTVLLHVLFHSGNLVSTIQCYPWQMYWTLNREAILNTRDKYEGAEKGRGKEEIGDKKKELNSVSGQPWGIHSWASQLAHTPESSVTSCGKVSKYFYYWNCRI